MSSDSARQPLYLRASNAARAPGDYGAFRLSLRERMASCNANAPAAADGDQKAVDDDERAPPPEAEGLWLAPQDRTASRIDEGATAANCRGREINECVFADLMDYPQKPAGQSEESWLRGFASLDDAFAAAKRGKDVNKSVIPGLVSFPGSDSETEPETDSDDESFVLTGSQPLHKDIERQGGGPHLYQNQVAQAGSGGDSVPPPSFRPGGGGPEPAPEEGPSNVETNPMAMLRATAREFVPTYFKPAPSYDAAGLDQITTKTTDIDAPALGAGGIWGGGKNVNQTASLGLARSNFASFMGEQDNNNEGKTDNNKTTWGTSTGGAGSLIW